jgi:hypothetical protein
MKTIPKRLVAAVYDRRIFLDNQQVPFCVLPCPPKPWRRWMRLVFLFLVGWLMGFSASAQVQQAWVARYNNGILNGTNQAVKIALDPTGNIYITGFSQNTNGILGYATIKYAPNGSQAWAARIDSTNTTSAIPTGLAADPSNNVFVTGSALTVKYSTNGSQQWTAPYAGAAVATDSNGDICIVGFSTDFGTVKLNPKGTNLWSATLPSTLGPAVSQKVAIDANGNVYVVGITTYMCVENECYVLNPA